MEKKTRLLMWKMTIFQTVHLISLITIVTCDSNIYKTVLNSFEESFPVHCVVLISEKSIPNINDFNLPIIKTSLLNPQLDLKPISNQCKNHVFVLNNFQDINAIKPQHIHVSVIPNLKWFLVFKEFDFHSLEVEKWP